MADKAPEQPTLKVLVYSDDASVRESVRLGLGHKPAADLPPVEYVDVATDWAVVETVRKGGIDLVIVDGEAVPSGGLGVCRTIKEEIFQAPAVLAILGRPQDQWLAAWARVNGTTLHPINPFALTEAATALLRTRVARTADLATQA